MMNFIFVSIILSLSGVASKVSPIGKSFYIPKIGLLDEELDGGYPIYDDVPTQCIHSDPDVEITKGGFTFHQDTNSFYHSIALDVSLPLHLAEDFTLGITLGYATKSISGSSNKVRGTTFRAYSQVSKEYLDMNCFTAKSLSADVVNAFEKLPATIDQPWLESEWQDYALFLEKYNTHVVTEVKYGSAIYQHCFSDASNSYTAKQYGIRACTDFAEGFPIANVGLGICVGVTNTDIDSVSSISTSSRLVLRGGTKETRSALYVSRTKKLMEQFLKEANVSQSPIQYKFISIWDLLKLKYSNTEHFAKVINLKAFYEGYLNFGCKYIVSDTKVELQKFNHSDLHKPSYPDYNCIIAPAGCHDTTDCHYRFLAWCECRGNSCVSYETVTTSTESKRKSPYIFTGPDNGWQNCEIDGFYCYCLPSDVWAKIWPQEESKFHLET